MTVQEFSEQYIHRVIHGEELANPRPSLPVGLPPPPEYFRNSPSCKLFANFVKKTLFERLRTGAISLKGRISEIELPHLVLPLTVEPSKPRLCHLWIWKAKWCKIQHRIFQLHLTSMIKFKIMYSSKSTSVILFNLRNLINFKER